MNEPSTTNGAAVLLELGDRFEYGDWPYYPAKYLLTMEDVPELLRIATDATLSAADPDGPLIWAPVHARRALAQLGAAEAVEPLLSVIRLTGDENDSLLDEMPRVLAMLGPAALPHLAASLRDYSKPMAERWIIGEAVGELAARRPETRAECVHVLADVIGWRDDVDRELNGVLIGELLKLRAVEALPVIREAYRRGAVSLELAGELEEVEIELGVREERAAAPHPMITLERQAPPGREPSRNAPCPCGSGVKYKKCCIQP